MSIEKLQARADEIHRNTDFAVSWFAKKYNKVIFRVGNMSKEGCIDPMITYKRAIQ